MMTYDVMKYNFMTYDLMKYNFMTYDIMKYDFMTYDVMKYDFMIYDIMKFVSLGDALTSAAVQQFFKQRTKFQIFLWKIE